MSKVEGEMLPRKQGVLRFGVPNESSPEEILTAASRITDHLFEDAIFSDPDYVIGTVVTLTVSIVGIRKLESREFLATKQELDERDFIVDHFHDFEFEED